MIVRVNKNTNYTVMSNHHLMNRNLSLKAKGLLSLILALPEGWHYSIAGLAAISKEKESAINSALKELKENGYLILIKKMPNETESGRIEYEWNFYEQPQNQKQSEKKQTTENQGFEFQGLENQEQLNTNILSTNELNTNRIDIICDKPKKSHFIPPTIEEVRAYCRERNSSVDPDKFFEYFQTGNWKDSKGNQVKNWKQKIITWEKFNNISTDRQEPKRDEVLRLAMEMAGGNTNDES